MATENKKNEWAEREIGVLWSKGDRLYGEVNGEKVVIFTNKFKEGVEARPDYRVYKERPLEARSPAVNEESELPV